MSQDSATTSPSSHTLELRRGDSGPNHNSDGLDLSTRPLAVLARQHIKPGCESKFEQWIDAISKLQRESFEGYRGSEVIRPIDGEPNEYISIFRYDTYTHLQTWMNSAVRQAWIAKTEEFNEEPIQVTYHSLEYSAFLLDGAASRPPKKYKMVLITFCIIWTQVHFFPGLVVQIPHLPKLLSEAMTVGIITCMTSYVWLPLFTRLLRRWLFPQQSYSDNGPIYNKMSSQKATA